MFSKCKPNSKFNITGGKVFVYIQRSYRYRYSREIKALTLNAQKLFTRLKLQGELDNYGLTEWHKQLLRSGWHWNSLIGSNWLVSLVAINIIFYELLIDWLIDWLDSVLSCIGNISATSRRFTLQNKEVSATTYIVPKNGK